MRSEQAQHLSAQEFKRLFGVQRYTFEAMVEVLQKQAKLKKSSGAPKLSLEDQVLVALQYWREYRTYFHIAQDWEVSEATIGSHSTQGRNAGDSLGAVPTTRKKVTS